MRNHFELQVAADAVLHILADHDLAEVLQIGQTVEKQDAFDQTISVFHLVNRLVHFMRAELVEAPVFVHPRVQEVLVDRYQLVVKNFV